MSEEKNDPQWKPNMMEPNVPTKIKILSATPIASGESKYGQWTLWPVEVENQTVFNKQTKEKMEGYSGKAIFFPSDKLEKKIVELINGKENAEIEIVMSPKMRQNGTGFYTDYQAKLVKEGNMPSSAVSYSNHKYLQDFNVLAKNMVLEENEEYFVDYGSKEPYNIDKDKLKDMWQIYLKEYKSE